MKPRPLLLVLGFTLTAQAAALAFTYQMMDLSQALTFEPVQGEQSPLLNVLVFLSLPVIGSLVYLRFRRSRLLKYVYSLAEALLVAFLSFLVLIFSGFDLLPSVMASSLTAVAGFLALTRGRSASKAAFGLLLSSESGAYLALIFKPPTVYFVFLLFALYDMFAVFRGPLKRVVEDTGFGALSVDFGSVSMGMGDEIFYAMAPSAAMMIDGPLAALAMVAIVDLGVLATLVLLSLRRALPGLTLPLLLGLSFFLLLALA